MPEFKTKDGAPPKRCEDCGAPLIQWDDAKRWLHYLVERHIEDVEKLADEGAKMGDTDHNWKELRELTLHQHAYVKAFVNWLAVKEHTDIKTLIELISAITGNAARVVVFLPPDTHGTGGPRKVAEYEDGDDLLKGEDDGDNDHKKPH